MNIGDLCTVTYEQSKQLRKEGWKPRNDVVVMMFVGPADPGVKSNIVIAASKGGKRFQQMKRRLRKEAAL
jgi:hypothetical protein